MHKAKQTSIDNAQNTSKYKHLRIAIFSDTYYPEVNGVATSCLNLANALRERGHEVHVFAPKCKNCQSQASEFVHFIPSLPLLVLKDRNLAFWGLKNIRKAVKVDFDVVHTNTEFNMGYMGRLIAWASHCPQVHTYHTVWEDYTYYVTHGKGDKAARKLVRKYSEWWCNHFERVITPTEKSRKLLDQYGVHMPIDVVPSGMDIRRFAPERHDAAQIREIRRECGVRDGERVLLNIGRIAREKNIEQVLRVFPRLHEKCPDVRLLIIGEGPMRSELGEMAKRLGVAEAVSLPGPKPWEKIDRYYAAGDVFVSCSHSETQGLTYIEAMASGLCVCAVNDPCLDGVIENGVNGLLCADDDDAVLECLLRAFSGEGARIRKNAPAKANEFSCEAFAENIEKVYRKAIADHQEAAK